jgi:UDP:flavonoid glycosyltransferase YjiC (YdhE family)
MRVVVSSTGGVGHVNPLIPLVQAMRHRGDDVLVVAAQPGIARVRAAGIPVVKAGVEARAAQAELAARWPEVMTIPGPEKPTFIFPRLFGAIAAPRLHPALRDAAREWRADVLVHDAAELAAPLVAAELGIPSACHSFGLAIPGWRVQLAADYVEPLWHAAGLEPRPFGGCYDHLYIDVYPRSMQPDDLSHIGRIVRRRPEGDVALADELLPEPLADDLASNPHRPFVYVTFGTVHNRDHVFSAVVRGVAQLGATVLVTAGADGDVGAFGELPPHVHVHEYVAQALVLPHASAVVSHAGSGTVLAALGHGITQLCVPRAADQYRNAEAVEAAGAGLQIVDEVTPERVEDDVLRLLDDDRFGAAAAGIAVEIASMPTAADVADELETLVAR